MSRERIIFKNIESSFFKRLKYGAFSGLSLGILSGIIEGHSIYFKLRGFNDSLLMLIITPLIYGMIGIIFGSLMGLIYHFFGYILRPDPDKNDRAAILSFLISFIFLVVSLTVANEILIFPRFHPVSIAIDIVILMICYFLWRILTSLLHMMFLIKRSLYTVLTIFIILVLAVYDLSIYKNFSQPVNPIPGRGKDKEADSVIILMIDTLRADHVGAYGYKREVTPTIDRLASSGSLFERTYSSSSWTVPAHFSLMTGVTSGAVRQEFSIAQASFTLAERMSLAGYRTACISANPLLSEALSFDQGFQLFDSRVNLLNRINDLEFFNMISHLKIQRPIRGNQIKVFNDASLVTDYALDWIGRYGNEPYFLFINYMDVHDPYLPPGKYGEMFSNNYKGSFTGDICGDLSEAEFIRDIMPGMTREDWDYVISQYDGAIRYVDDQILRIIQALEANQTLENTILIIMSDHGELFGEYNLATHHLTLSEEETRIPLIIHYPRVIRKGMRIKNLARIIDVYPTLMTLLNLKMPDKVFVEGVSLLKNDGTISPTPGTLGMVLYENRFKASILGPAFNRDLFSFVNNDWKYIKPEVKEEAKESINDTSIFRHEQIIERLFKVNENGVVDNKDVLDESLRQPMRFNLLNWRKAIKEKKPPLGDLKGSAKLTRDMSTLGYIQVDYSYNDNNINESGKTGKKTGTPKKTTGKQ